MPVMDGVEATKELLRLMRLPFENDIEIFKISIMLKVLSIWLGKIKLPYTWDERFFSETYYGKATL